MNKVFALAVVAVLLSANVALAQEVPQPPVLTIGNGDPGLVMQVWGLTGKDTPTFAPGQSVTDEAGYVDVCPAWYPKMGCANISKTEYYRKSHIEVARQLVANKVLHLFPSFSYWAKFVQ